MKIAIIQPRSSYYVAGSEKVSFKHAEYLSKLGNEIDFYTSISNDVSDSFLFKEFIDKELKNINIFRFDISKVVPNLYNTKPDTEHLRWLTESLAFDQIIYNDLLKNKPDIIFSYYLPDNLFKPLSVPNVVYLSGYPKNRIPFYKSFMDFVNSTISISMIVSEKWTEETSRVKSNYVLGTGVDYPITINDKINKKARYDLVYAGRIIERKGLFTLIEAFNEVANSEDIHMWILGEGELLEIAQNRARELNLNNKITFTGNVSNPYDYFLMSDICIFPSHEGDGLMGTVLEAMSAGKPVITTVNNGNEDVIENDVNGILIKSKNINELSSAIMRLIKNHKLRSKLGNNAKSFIETNKTWGHVSKQLNEILKNILMKK